VKSPLFRLPLDDASIPWISTHHPGISWHPLDPEEVAAKTKDVVVLIRMAPGRGYPPHRHLGVEHVLVLQGGYVDELGEHRAGTMLRYAAGSAHSPVAAGDPDLPESAKNRACILLAIARGGVEELPA
jgi:anti-sigma factor ChrR (cupin superfamily)